MKDSWIRDLERSKKELITIDKVGDVVFYKTLEKYSDGRNYYYASPVYHVWNGDNWVVATTNFQDAVGVFEREAGK